LGLRHDVPSRRHHPIPAHVRNAHVSDSWYIPDRRDRYIRKPLPLGQALQGDFALEALEFGVGDAGHRWSPCQQGVKKNSMTYVL
jgi:hypothetical protein